MTLISLLDVHLQALLDLLLRYDSHEAPLRCTEAQAAQAPGRLSAFLRPFPFVLRTVPVASGARTSS